jgi:hypothetical protein
MLSSRIRTSHQDGEVAPNTWHDFDWVHENEAKLLEQYGECILLVYNQQVIGTGATIEEAIAQAEQTVPASVADVTPITYFLQHRHPFFRVYPDKTKG